MSYILDALNKAERERGIKEVPVPMAVRYFQAAPGKRLWVIAAGLLVCAASAVWLFLPSRNSIDRPPDPSRVSAEHNRGGSQAGVEPVGESIPVIAEPSPYPPAKLAAPARSGLPSGTPMIPAVKANVPHDNAVRNSVEGASRLSPSTPAETSSGQSLEEKATPQAAPGSSMGIPATKDVLSAPRVVQGTSMSLREAMDKMTITILVYAEAKAERFVFINGRRYVEGDRVDGRYLIESITLEGAVLSHEGERAILRSGPK